MKMARFGGNSPGQGALLSPFTLAAVLTSAFALISPAAAVPSVATFVAVLGRSLGRIDERGG
jgi:hypothetical protein